MYATILTTNETFPIDSLADGGLYLRILGHARYFALHLLIVH